MSEQTLIDYTDVTRQTANLQAAITEKLAYLDDKYAQI